MRKRLLLNYIIILILGALITGALAFYFIHSSYTISKEDKLLTNISLIENVLEENYKNKNNVNFFKLAQDLSLRTNSRVTFIRTDGIPIADSINNSIIFQSMESNQEFRHAMRNDRTVVKGYSQETGKKYFYITIPPITVGKIEVVLRLGDSFDEVDLIIEEFVLYLVTSTIIGVSIAILIAYFRIGEIVKPVKELTEASRLMAEGYFDRKIIVNTKDEIQELSISYNRMAEKLKITINELKDLEKMRKDFVANVSHELRTPLTSILGFVETLKTKDLDKKDEMKALDIIEFETERLKELINEILKLSKIESIIEIKKLEEIYIENIILEVLNILEPQMQSSDIKFILYMDKNLNKIKGDKDLFKQLLINLIENAIKYNRPQGEIKLSVLNEIKGIKLIVEDSGIGIPEDDLPWIFERFYRVDKSRSNNREGTGLGLAIVATIVSYFGGIIEVESKLGKGSKFTITFNK